MYTYVVCYSCYKVIPICKFKNNSKKYKGFFSHLAFSFFSVIKHDISVGKRLHKILILCNIRCQLQASLPESKQHISCQRFGCFGLDHSWRFFFFFFVGYHEIVHSGTILQIAINVEIRSFPTAYMFFI